MGKLSAYTFCTINGFYKDHLSDINWHVHGEEETRFSAESLNHGHTLLFGRVTYEMMFSFWPTPDAAKAFPEVATGMNKAEKLVVSGSLKSSGWENTTILNDGWLDTLADMKKSRNIILLGSGTLLTRLSEADLIDKYEIMIDPVIIGKGTSMFCEINQKTSLKLIDSRTFKSGSVLLTYERNES